MNVLVTGAEGFAGRVLAEGLRERGDSVRALIAKGTPAVVRARFERARITVHECARDDEDAIAAAAKGVECIVHTAPDQRLRGTLKQHNKQTLIPAEATLAAAQRSGVRRVLLISNEAVTAGNSSRGYVDEMLPHASDHVSAYGEAMAIAEALITAANGAHDTETVVLRPGLLWGPDDDEYLPEWIRRAKARTFELVGEGTTLLPTTFTANLVSAARNALIASIAAGRVYYVSDDERITPKQFFTRLLVALQLPAPRRRVPFTVEYASAWLAERFGREREFTRGDVVRFGTNVQFNLQRARDEIQFVPMHIDAGLKQFVRWAERAGGADVIARGDVCDLSSVVAMVESA